ncbi:hypothetical protein QR680_005380 [Steinernema hermaphroditum]|uniref:FERM domain-containing protein n=1 Tax=Steinernema hermaphroditum TaxID=289476 RepID=A0AA39HRS2_9BILA|nr:hypothetical protein QR680_005380 [Steinernema hermaphroditum]
MNASWQLRRRMHNLAAKFVRNTNVVHVVDPNVDFRSLLNDLPTLEANLRNRSLSVDVQKVEKNYRRWWTAFAAQQTSKAEGLTRHKLRTALLDEAEGLLGALELPNVIDVESANTELYRKDRSTPKHVNWLKKHGMISTDEENRLLHLVGLPVVLQNRIITTLENLFGTHGSSRVSGSYFVRAAILEAFNVNENDYPAFFNDDSQPLHLAGVNAISLGSLFTRSRLSESNSWPMSYYSSGMTYPHGRPTDTRLSLYSARQKMNFTLLVLSRSEDESDKSVQQVQSYVLQYLKEQLDLDVPWKTCHASELQKCESLARVITDGAVDLVRLSRTGTYLSKRLNIVADGQGRVEPSLRYAIPIGTRNRYSIFEGTSTSDMSEGPTSRGVYVGSIDEPCTSTWTATSRRLTPESPCTSTHTTPKSSRSLNLKMFSVGSVESSSVSGISPRKEGTKRAKIIAAGQSFVFQKQKIIQVHTLEKECLTVGVEPKCRVTEVYACCCAHLGIEDDRFFGLAQRCPSEGIGGDRPRNEYFFLEFDQKVSKYLPKHSKFSRSTTVEKNRPQLVLFFRVRVYIEKIPYISCDVSLKYYYLQLRENLVDQWSGPHTVSEERCWEMAMLALQADKYDNQVGFFRAENYFPLWVINLRGLDYVKQNMPNVLQDFRKPNEREAMISFCQEASRSPFALNCHLYGLRRHKMDVRNNALLGITDRGIDMWDVGEEGDRIPLRSLAFNRIARLCFDKKRLTICGLEGSKMSLYTSSNDSARYLLRFCREVHLQQIQINIYFAQHPESVSFTCPGGWGREQGVDTGIGMALCERHSLVSQTSNSTSGIVSDRQHSDAEKENDAESSSEIQETFRPLTPVRSENEEEEEEESRDKEVAKADLQKAPPAIDTSIRAGSSAYASASSSIANASETQPIFETLHPIIYACAESVELTALPSKSLSAPPPPAVAPPALPPTTRYVQNVRKANMTSKSDDSSYLPNMVTLSEPSESPPIDLDLYPLGANYVAEPSLMNQSPIPTIPYGQAPLTRPQIPSLSLHDLRMPMSTAAAPFQNPAMGIRQPPCYSEATSAMRSVYAPSAKLQKPLLSPQQRPLHSHQHSKPRWTTVTGLDPQLMAMMEQMQLEQSAMNAFHQARSEPRLHQSVWNGVTNPAVLPDSLSTLPASYAVPPVAPSQPPQGGRRYKSRSPSNRGINRVKSMPAHSMVHEDFHGLHASMAQQLSNHGLHHAQSLNQGSNRVHMKPSTYSRGLDVPNLMPATSTAFAAQRPSAGHFVPTKRNSSEEHQKRPERLNSDDFSRIKDFPMMSALWQEHQRGIVGSSSPSTSSDATGTVSTSSTIRQPADLRLSPPRRPSFSCQDLSAPSSVSSQQMSSSLHAGYPPPQRTVADVLPSNLNWERYLVLPSVSSADIVPSASSLYATEPASSSRSYLPYATSVLLQQNLDGRTSGTYSPAFATQVLDLPPPPPYPQSSPNSRKAPMVM